MNILGLVKRFVSIKFRYFFRVLNVAAHSLAKFCLKSNVEAEFFLLLFELACWTIQLIFICFLFCSNEILLTVQEKT